jgi:DEAD/DEAH box helicase domain-containing protein
MYGGWRRYSEIQGFPRIRPIMSLTHSAPPSAPLSSEPLPAGVSDLEDILTSLAKGRRTGDQVVHIHRISPVEAVHAPFPGCLDKRVCSSLRKSGIEQLFSHQAEAVERSMRGEHIAVVTPTASGKTMCYNLPVIQRILNRPESRALYLFPTKALSHDQYEGLHALTGTMGHDIRVYTYDGDTPASARRNIRSAGQIVITNPDMLHSGILPHHTRWIKLFENLETIVIDELHQYRGVFGSHVANVIRRLARICEFYGSRPVFICCSATVGNPGEMAEQLTGRPVSVINQNGGPRGERVVVLYNPPVVNRELGIRESSVKESRRLAVRFLEKGFQTIIFTRSRVRVEVLTKYLKRTFARLGFDPGRIAGYRGGYLPNLRRSIEKGVREGDILGVVSTNALELGVDCRLRSSAATREVLPVPGSRGAGLEESSRPPSS